MVDRGESCVRGDLPSKPALRATLRKGAKPSEVYVVPVDSRPGNELHVVAVRSAGAFVTAAPVLACSQGVDVAKVRAFPGQDSLVVTCRSGTGGHDYDATTTMWHPRTDVLHPVLTFWKGVRAEIVEQPGCHHAPRGSLSVVNAGAEPVLRTVAPLLDKEGAFTGRSATIRWSWRADKWRFEGSQPRLGPALEAIKVCGRK